MASRLPYRVYIDWDRDGFDAADEVGEDYARAVSWSIGLRRGGRVASVGKCTIVLGNTDRRFSPDYASGPHYGKLLPNLPVRVDFLDNGTTRTVFRGVTDSFRASPHRLSDPTTTVRCSDLLSKLRDANTLSLPLRYDHTPAELLALITSAAFGGGTASNPIVMKGLPVSGVDGMIINGTAYAWVTTPGANAYYAKTATTIAEAMDNMQAAINGGEGIGTAYGSATIRHPDVALIKGQTQRISIPATIQTSLNRPEVGNSNTYWQAQRFVMPVTGQVSQVRVWIAEAQPGTAGSALVVELRNETSDSPGSTIYATASKTGGATESYLDIPIVGPLLAEDAPFWVVLRSTTAATYFLYGSEGDFYTDGLWKSSDNAGASWNVPGDYDLRLDIDFMPQPRLEAVTEGAWGNEIATVASGTAVEFSYGDALYGGEDAPVGLLDFEAGGHTLDLVGGEWRAGETNGLRAVEDVVSSVGGYFWAASDGKLTYRSLDWWLTRASAAAALVIDSDENDLKAEVAIDDIVNVVTGTIVDRREIVSGVVATAPELIAVPGRWGEEPVARWTKNAPTEPGAVTLRLPYVNPDTGKYLPALTIAQPIAGVDYTVNDKEDGTGFDYSSTGQITLSIAPAGADLEVTLSNAALGSLYVRNLHFDGTRFTDVTEVQITEQDTDSITAYGRRAPLRVDLPFAVGEEFSRSYIRYLLSRGATARTAAQSVSFTNRLDVGGVSLFALDIGDVVELTDWQTGIDAQRYLIVGIDGAMAVDGSCGLTFALERIDDKTYWILGDDVFGVLGSTTRLGV